MNPLAALLLLVGLGLSPAAPAADRRPNVLFLFSDDHAPSAIGAFDERFAALDPTPRLDAFAREGMLFRRSFCTNSICGPSRAVILTGKHSHVNGFRKNGDRFDGSQPTFPKLLRAAGYRTALIGKWHLGSDPEGFDHWDVLPGQGDYYNPVLVTAAGRRRVEGYCTDVVADLALDWIEARQDDDAPFLMMCQFKAPHRNWMPALRHLDLWDDVDVPLPETLFDDHADDASPARAQEMEVGRHLNLVYDLFLEPDDAWDPNAGTALDASGFRNLGTMTSAQRATWDAAFADENAAFRAAALEGEALVRWKCRRYLKNYLRTVRGLDEAIGRILDRLDALGLADDTIVVYSSDQGFFLGDHGWYDKRWMYEESLAMPLIVRWPGVTPPGSTCDALVQNLDHAPTLLDAAGVDVPADMQGRSLVPLLRGETPPDWRDAIYYRYFGHPDVHDVALHYGVRTQTHKLIRFPATDEWELFDLVADPDERTNLFGRAGTAPLAAALAQRLGELRESYGDE